MELNTCFILGAGFSAPAGLPLQSDLLQNADDIVKNIISRIFNKEDIDDDTLAKIKLEDVFTFLDKIIYTNGSVYNYDNYDYKNDFDIKSAYDAKHGLIEFIVKKIINKQKQLKCRRGYEHFFESIVRRKLNGETNTVITINWDTLPDFFINKAYEHFGIEKGGADYCAYDWNIDDADNGESGYVPSILRKAKSWSTIKVIKLHGSVNWGHSKKDGALWIKPQTGDCPNGISLDKSGIENKDWHKRFEYIFMSPTFTKDFSNLHTKTMWHNAAFDLSEAKRIVFLGCSLPLADYEFRNLFLRTAVRNHKNKYGVFSV